MKAQEEPAAEVRTGSSWNAVPFFTASEGKKKKNIQAEGQKSGPLGIALRFAALQPRAAAAGLRTARGVMQGRRDRDGRWVVMLGPPQP